MNKAKRFKVREFSIVWWMMGAMWFGMIYGLIVLWLAKAAG